jgi:hypothetical protein
MAEDILGPGQGTSPTTVSVTGPVLVSDTAATLTNGRKTVASAGTAEAIRATLVCKWVTVTALPTNTAQVNVGASGVLATSGTQTGIPLSPGDSTTLTVADAAIVFVDAAVSGQGVSFVVGS